MCAPGVMGAGKVDEEGLQEAWCDAFHSGHVLCGEESLEVTELLPIPDDGVLAEAACLAVEDELAYLGRQGRA